MSSATAGLEPEPVTPPAQKTIGRAHLAGRTNDAIVTQNGVVLTSVNSATHATAMTAGAGAFNVVRPHRRVRWRRLAEADVPGMQRRGDIHGIISHLEDVAYGDVGDFVDAPPALMKAFNMGQFSIQYLLHTQEVLREGAAQCDARREKARSKLQSVKRRLKAQREEWKLLAAEHRRVESVLKSHGAIVGTIRPELANVPPEDLDDAIRRGAEARVASDERQQIEEEKRKARQVVQEERRKLAEERKRWHSEREEEQERIEKERESQDFRRQRERDRELREEEQRNEERRKREEEEEERAEEERRRRESAEREATRKRVEEEERRAEEERWRRESAEREATRKREEEEERAEEERRRRELAEKEAKRKREKEEEEEEERARRAEEERRRQQLAEEQRRKEMEAEITRRRDLKKKEIEEARANAREREEKLQAAKKKQDEGSAVARKEKLVVNFNDSEDSRADESSGSIPTLATQEESVASPRKEDVPDDKDDEIARLLVQRLEEERDENGSSSPQSPGANEASANAVGKIERDKERHLKSDQKRRQERQALAESLPELKKGEISKYSKAFVKWEEGDGVSSENIKDLLDALPGKLKWNLTDKMLETLLGKMGVSASKRRQGAGGAVFISKDKFLEGLRFRTAIEDGTLSPEAPREDDIQETLDLLDASSFGDDWDDGSVDESVDAVIDLSTEEIL